MTARGTAGTDGHFPLDDDAITRAELPSDRPVPRDPSHPTRDPHPHARPTPSSTTKPTATERCIHCRRNLKPPLAYFCNSKCIDAYARTWNPGAEQAVDQLLEANDGHYPPKATPASRATTRQPTQEEKP